MFLQLACVPTLSTLMHPDTVVHRQIIEVNGLPGTSCMNICTKILIASTFHIRVYILLWEVHYQVCVYGAHPFLSNSITFNKQPIQTYYMPISIT